QAAKHFSYVGREVRSNFTTRTSKRTLTIINNPLPYFNSLLYQQSIKYFFFLRCRKGPNCGKAGS
uniref:Uncharacterized protein n=1 Tax=Aegilops tauschii subsp. strangulata TaxID=200361 RepID=A0A453EDY9_AEGTS